jgi:hypothetical protein
MQVAFIHFTAGAVIVQMGQEAVENMDSIGIVTPLCMT